LILETLNSSEEQKKIDTKHPIRAYLQLSFLATVPQRY
jgi:hypothetical protein